MVTAPIPDRYTRTAALLHWLLALAIVSSFCVGLYMHELPFSPRKLQLFNLHKWAGITILALSALRLLWRLFHRPPALPAAVRAGMPTWQRWAHHGTHGLLYLLFFAVPLAGWGYSSAVGFPIVWFGVLPLPDFVNPDKALAESLKEAHKVLSFGLAALVIVHVVAALKHQFIDRDGLLGRMRFGR